MRGYSTLKQWFDWYAGHVTSEGDCPTVIMRKRTMLAFMSLLLVPSPLVLVTGTLFYKFAVGIMIVTCVVGLLWLFLTKSCTPRFILSMLYPLMVSIMVGDLSTVIVTQPRNWPMMIIIIDLMLVLELDRRSSVLAVGFSVAWLLVTTMENSYRFGLYDLPLSPDDERRSAVFDCEGDRLPCALGPSRALPNWFINCMIFMLDFYFTRRFQHESIRERTKVNNSITTAKSIASSMAAFDLETASMHLTGSEDLPSELYTAFETILCHLQTYRPYLPDACIPFNATEEDPVVEFSHPPSESTHTRSRSQSSCQSSRADKDSVVSTERIFVPRAASVPHLQKRRLSMVLMTVQTGLEGEGTMHYAHSYNACLSVIYSTVKAHKGLVDMFTGEQVSVVFNSLRPCIMHTVAAVRSALSLHKQLVESEQATLSVGISSGFAAFGDLGTIDAKRVVHMGKAPYCVKAVEACARKCEVSIVCDSGVYHDASTTHVMKLLLQRFHFAQYSEHTTGFPVSYLYEVQPTLSAEASGTGEEWMYRLEKSAGKLWERYNDAGLRYLKRQGADEVMRIMNAGGRVDKPNVAEAMKGLQALVSSGQEPETLILYM